jgi:hypothetical protein
MKIANKKLVNSMKKILLQELDEQFKHNYSNLEMLFKRNIKKSINKTAKDIKNDINNFGSFIGRKRGNNA